MFLGGKGIDPLEGAIRVPGIIRWPQAVKPQTVITHPTSLMDFLPTISDITGYKSPPKNVSLQISSLSTVLDITKVNCSSSSSFLREERRKRAVT